MSLDAFAARYRALFALLGPPLQPEDGVNSDNLEHFNLEGMRLPEALRAYYLVAGNERRLNHSFNRLLALEDMFVEAGRLVFMEENQNVVYWGVSSEDANPTVEQGINLHPEPLEWHSESVNCAEFLEVTLVWQASFGGGSKHCVTAPVTPDVRQRLEASVALMGKMNELSVYAQDGCALSVLKWDDGWRVFAGFHTRKAQTSLGREIGVRWEEL
ncbi:MAG: hypothetical protein HC933_12345 [Pleurocapsa sp. SU_196_0]|nr:hypothetical protein [Pleurocapsa sp. SU_196_0]